MVLTKKCKIRSKGAMKGSRDLLLKFWDPSISQQRLKLETSNLAWRLATGGPKRKKCKITSTWVVTYFLTFWDPVHMSATAEDIKSKFGTQIGHWGS